MNNAKLFLLLFIILIMMVIMQPHNPNIMQLTSVNWDNKSFYQEDVLKSKIHLIPEMFLNMTTDKYVKIYQSRYPDCNEHALNKLLNYRPKYIYWAGNDLFPVIESGKSKMLVIETNSCPGGISNMLPTKAQPMVGYVNLIKNTFIPIINNNNLPNGKLAVIYDTNELENKAYAQTIKNLTGEDVYAIYYKPKEFDSSITYINNVLHIRDNGSWVPIRAVFRYITQKPWTIIPFKCRTLIFNSVEVCFAGGRNKHIASIAYNNLNESLKPYGLKINLPQTIINIKKENIPQIINEHFKGQAVIKVPYSNKGQGVYTILNTFELNKFMDKNHDYNNFIVQSVIGPLSMTNNQNIYNRGTKKDSLNRSYIFDMRLICAYNFDKQSIRPVSFAGRKAKLPISAYNDNIESWNILGTNISYKTSEGSWGKDYDRFIRMTDKDFDQMGLDLTDLVDGYVQTVLCMIAIDQMAIKIFENPNHMETLFKLNPDIKLIKEIRNNQQFFP